MSLPSHSLEASVMQDKLSLDKWCINFLGLLQQITTNWVAKATGIHSLSVLEASHLKSWGWWGWHLLGALRGNLSPAFPSSPRLWQHLAFLGCRCITSTLPPSSHGGFPGWVYVSESKCPSSYDTGLWV